MRFPAMKAGGYPAMRAGEFPSMRSIRFPEKIRQSETKDLRSFYSTLESLFLIMKHVLYFLLNVLFIPFAVLSLFQMQKISLPGHDVEALTIVSQVMALRFWR